MSHEHPIDTRFLARVMQFLGMLSDEQKKELEARALAAGSEDTQRTVALALTAVATAETASTRYTNASEVFQAASSFITNPPVVDVQAKRGKGISREF